MSILAGNTQYRIGAGDRTFLIVNILLDVNTDLPSARILQPRHLTGLLLPATEKDAVLPVVAISSYSVETTPVQSIMTRGGRGEGPPVPATSMSHSQNQLHQRQVGQWPPAADAALPGSAHW